LAPDANIILKAKNDIIIKDLNDDLLAFQATTGSVTFTADADGDGTGSFSMESAADSIATWGGAVTISGASITVGSIDTTSTADGVNGGAVTLWAIGDINITGTSIFSPLSSIDAAWRGDDTGTGNGGAITITAVNGNINVARSIVSIADQNAIKGIGGNITLIAGGNIRFEDAAARADGVNGKGGDITLIAGGNIDSDDIQTIGSLSAGDIQITSGGTINTTLFDATPGAIRSCSGSGTTCSDGSGNGGNVTLQAVGDITVSAINSNSGSQSTAIGGAINVRANGNITIDGISSPGRLSGGDINLRSLSGSINNPRSLNSSSENGNGGAIALNAAGNINTSFINSNGKLDGGAITIISTGGIIDTTAGTTTAVGGRNGGNVTFTAPGDINTGTIGVFFNSGFSGDSGSITINSSSGNINTSTGALLTPSALGSGGDITLNAVGSITTGQINALSLTNTGGKIDLRANTNITTNRDIETNRNSITFNGPLTLPGNVSFTSSAAGNITFNNTVNGTQNLILNTDNGTVRFNNVVGGSTPLNNLRVEGDITTTNPAGVNITTVNNITTGNITSPGGIALTSSSRNITTGVLNSFSFGNGGNINLVAPGNITVSQINAQSLGIGTGGNVDITTESFFRATDSFPDQNGVDASISTAGGADGGTIIIRHGGGGVIPFVVGNAETNGTEEAITRGNAAPEQTISPTQQYFYTHKQDADRIQIISIPGTSPLPPDPIPVPEPIPLPERGRNPLESLALLVGDTLEAETEIEQDPQTGDYSFAWHLYDQRNLSINVDNPLPIGQVDKLFEEQFEEYFGENITDEAVTVESIRDTLKTIESQTGKSPVVVYARSFPDQLELVLVLPEGYPIRRVVPEANAAALQKTLSEFHRAVRDFTDSRGYKAPAQQLYQWMIAPIESDLKGLGIDTLIFCMDAGLRLIPMAALHDGQQFLVEKYSIGSIPSVSLTNSRYKPVKDAQVLGMGASKFQKLSPLPAVPMELEMITRQLWSGESFLNENFTLDNLKAQRQQKPFEIIHLATHAEFQSGDASNSYIQLWDTQLSLDRLRQMGWQEAPQVELLALSACRTAVGDERVELGFAGLAVQAGVKSALASLWYVNDEGTLALMSGFYQHLRQPDVTIKAEALRRAQIAMLRGQVRLENGQLQGLEGLGSIPLPPELAARGNNELSHPFYWAGFTMIGSPW
jgi:CHAT domain-containing protein